MIKIHRRIETTWVKLSDDDDTEFQIRPLNSPTMIDVQNGVSFDEDSGNILLTGAAIMSAVRYGVLDWKGVADENEQPIKFSIDRLEWLPASELKLLASKVISLGRLTEPERKNS